MPMDVHSLFDNAANEESKPCCPSDDSKESHAIRTLLGLQGDHNASKKKKSNPAGDADTDTVRETQENPQQLAVRITEAEVDAAEETQVVTPLAVSSADGSRPDNLGPQAMSPSQLDPGVSLMGVKLKAIGKKRKHCDHVPEQFDDAEDDVASPHHVRMGNPFLPAFRYQVSGDSSVATPPSRLVQQISNEFAPPTTILQQQTSAELARQHTMAFQRCAMMASQASRYPAHYATHMGTGGMNRERQLQMEAMIGIQAQMELARRRKQEAALVAIRPPGIVGTMGTSMYAAMADANANGKGNRNTIDPVRMAAIRAMNAIQAQASSNTLRAAGAATNGLDYQQQQQQQQQQQREVESAMKAIQAQASSNTLRAAGAATNGLDYQQQQQQQQQREVESGNISPDMEEKLPEELAEVAVSLGLPLELAELAVSLKGTLKRNPKGGLCKVSSENGSVINVRKAIELPALRVPAGTAAVKNEAGKAKAARERAKAVKKGSNVHEAPHGCSTKIRYEKYIPPSSWDELTEVPRMPFVEADDHFERPILELGEFDVLLGRGGMTNAHPGNMWFRRIVEKFRFHYCTAPKGDKGALARYLSNYVRANDGKFLTKDPKVKDSSSAYFEVGDNKSVSKCAQALREGTADLIRDRLQVDERPKL